MAAERGQATVEWIGLLLLIALALTALSRLAPAADERSLGTTLARSLTAAAKRPGGREPTRSSTPTRSALPQRAAAIPPAAPRPPGAALRGAAAIPPPAPPPLGAALRGATAEGIDADQRDGVWSGCRCPVAAGLVRLSRL